MAIPLVAAPVSADRIQSALNALIDQINQYFGGLTPESVDITGGTIDNTVIGGTTPAAGSFTSFTATSGNINSDTIATLTAAQTLTNKIISSPAITGGTLNNATIGGVTPGTATFTQVSFSTTSGLIGSSTNDSAATGSVGEYVSSSVAAGSAAALTNNTGKTITSISLTAGDWDVWVDAYFSGGTTTTLFYASACVSLTNNTQDTTNGRFAQIAPSSTTFGNGNQVSLNAGPVRLSLSATTTVYFVAEAGFSTSTCAAYGIIQARRCR